MFYRYTWLQSKMAGPHLTLLYTCLLMTQFLLFSICPIGCVAPFLHIAFENAIEVLAMCVVLMLS